MYNRRTLADPGLLAWFDSLGEAHPAGSWTARQLAVAASWFRPDRITRSAEVRAADATLVTAGARPQPGLSSDLEYAFSDPQSSSRWGVALAGLFTLELGGKRGARIARTRAAALAARAVATEGEWDQVNRVYLAAFGWYRARQLLGLAREERLALDSVVVLAQARYEGGTLARLDVARVEGERRAGLAGEQAAEQEEALALAALAREIGVPVNAVADLQLAEGAWPVCEAPGDSRDGLQRTALGARWTIRRAAAEYQVAEGDLRIEVANASPDLTLGPGMFFDQGTGKFTLSAGLPSLPLTRNRGPIGESEARRAVAAGRLVREQETVLSDVDGALAGCEAASRGAATSAAVAVETARRARLVAEAYDRGETGRLEVLAARLELVRVRRAVLDAELRRNEAGLALERAVGAWGVRADGPWPRARAPEPPGRTE